MSIHYPDGHKPAWYQSGKFDSPALRDGTLPTWDYVPFQEFYLMDINSTVNENLLLERVQWLEKQGIDPYPNAFSKSCSLLEVNEKYEGVSYRGKAVDLNLCGRVMNIRHVGKTVHLEIEERDARLRLVIPHSLMTTFSGASLHTIIFRGDWIGFKVDRIFRTHKGELAASALDWSFLAVCLNPLPSSLKSLRHQPKQRYLQLATDIRTRENFIARSKIIRYLRRFLEDKHDFLEVNSQSTLVPADKGESQESRNAGPNNVTSSKTLQYSILGGMERVYEICQTNHWQAPNELHDWGTQIMQCYMAPAGLGDMLELTEALINGLAHYLHSTPILPWNLLEHPEFTGEHFQNRVAPNAINEPADNSENIMIDLSPSWPHRTIYEMVADVTGVDFLKLCSPGEAFDIALKTGVELDGSEQPTSIGSTAMKVIDQLVAPSLIQPTFLTHYPVETHPDVKRSRTDQRVVEYAELFINGMCFAKAFNVPTDPRQQSGSGDPVNVDFVSALKYGMPPTAELQMRVDYLVMLMTGAVDLRDITFFPMSDGEK